MDYENQKNCGTCQQVKPLDSFAKNKAKRDGHDAKCTPCRKAYYKSWYQENKAKVIATTKAYYANNTEACKARNRNFNKNNPDKARKYSRENGRKYRGLPTATRPCPDHCEMCLKPAGKRALHLDHDHTTGEFRGWLCVCCNTGFGRLGDSFDEARQRLDTYEKTITPKEK